MRKMVYILSVFTLVTIAIIAYTYWYNRDIKTDITVEQTGAALLGDTFGLEEQTIRIDGTLTSAKLDTGGIFLGEIQLGDQVYKATADTQGMRLENRSSLYYGTLVTSGGERISIYLEQDLSAGSFINDQTGTYHYYPYADERLTALRENVERMRNRIFD